MKKRFFPWGCLLAAAVVIVLLALGAAFWLFRSQLTLGKTPAPPPIRVFLLTPSSGDEVHAGDFVAVTLNAQAAAGIANAELFVDGNSLGSVANTPERAWWSWQAWPLGIHTLSARATSVDGHVGQSQTVIVNVLALSPIMQVAAQNGQTLAQVGAKYGVSPDQMGGANPNVDPGQPLPDGQPVNVPTGGGGGGAPPQPPGGSPPQPPGGLPPQPPGGGGGAGGGIPISIIWDFKLTKPADKSYCYISTGDGTWDKMPKEPFDFFQGLDNLYTQLLDGNVHAHMVLQADCWGWQGGVLEYLGQGQTQFDFGQALVQLVLNADGFQLIGTPQFPPGNTPEAGMILPQIEAPYALREPTSTQDCLSHGGGSFDCDTALNAPLKTDMVLQWEWQPGVHWPGDPSWITAIDGYDLFEIDPSTNAQQLMGEVTPAGVKVGSLPLPWGPWCYGVQAYADDPQYGGKVVSALTEYCPGTPPTMQHLDATPTEWVTRGHTSWDIGDCPTNNYYDEAGDSGVNVNSAAVLVGSWIQKGGGCEIRQGNFWAGVKFNVSLPPGAVLQKATLKFNLAALLYGATHVALGASPTSCAADVGVAQLDWSALSTYPFYSESAYAFYPVYSAPFTSIGGGQADVTAIVADWLSHPGNNHGFFLTPAESLMPQPLDVEDNGGSGLCLSWLHNFGLYYEYFAP